MCVSAYTKEHPIRIGIDMGGTFVDCVLLDGGRVVATGKAPTTHDDPVAGIVAALAALAGDAGLETRQLLASAREIVHGTTVGLNALLTRTGGRVGLLATAGHEDAVLIGRVHQKVAGLGPDELIRVSELRRPEPLVPRWRIFGIDERIDRDGEIVTPLDEQAVAVAADELAADGCEAVAIAFLWSFRAAAHERRAAAIVRERHPYLAVTISSDVAPVLGEYERVATTVVNAYLLAVVTGYLERLEGTLSAHGFAAGVSMMTSAGGAVPVGMAAARPVETLGSGPVGGVVAAKHVAAGLGLRDVIATDMGGTSFDVSLLTGGHVATTDVTVVARLHLAVPAVDVRSIGAGGGSIAWLDDDGGLHVGPRAAPPGVGPACYGLGGSQPTVTDADLVLGRLDPAAVLGGRIHLSPGAAERAIAPLARELGVDIADAAAGIVRVADARMADLVRRSCLERGHDPRAMTLLSFGGAGPLHVGAVAPDVAVRRAIVPAQASVLSAEGLARAGWRRAYRRSMLLPVPFDTAAAETVLTEMEALARSDAGAGLAEHLFLERAIDMRWRRQTHHVTVPLPRAFDQEAMTDTVVRFERRYEEIHGPGTGYRAAGIEATALRIVATTEDALARTATAEDDDRGSAHRADPVAWRAVHLGGWMGDVPVYDGAALPWRSTLEGPALMTWPTTTLVVHPGHRAEVLPGGHVRIDFAAGDR